MPETRFDACLAVVLGHEGGFADHPDDPGGATNMGITRRTLADWRGVSPWQDLDKAEVAALTRAEAAKIYRARYWQACAADHLPAGLDLAVFDFAVNSGPVRAIRTLQALVGAEADGIVGPRTVAAVTDAVNLSGAASVVDRLCDARLTFLRSLSTFPHFGRGWTRRVGAIRDAAKAAAAPLSFPQRKTTMDSLIGYRTYIIAALMLVAGVAQILGIDMPSLESSSAGHLILEALAVLFLRKGLKNDAAKV